MFIHMGSGLHLADGQSLQGQSLPISSSKTRLCKLYATVPGKIKSNPTIWEVEIFVDSLLLANDHVKARRHSCPFTPTP